MSATKTCRGCAQTLAATTEWFYRHRLGAGGLHPRCKACVTAAARAVKRPRIRDQRAYLRAYYEAHKAELGEKNKLRAEANKDRVAAKQREWRLRNVDHLRDEKRRWAAENRERMTLRRRERAAVQWKSDPRFRLRKLIAHAIRQSLRTGKGGRRWESVVGYGLDDLVQHIESQFQPGMTWENHGKHGWHIDHIHPIAAFEFESLDDPQFRECWALSNLQPLWAADNLRKGARVA